MKAKRAIAWFLVCVLQLGVCLIIPLHGQKKEREMEQNGEACRFAVHSVRGNRDSRRPTVSIDFPSILYEATEDQETTWYRLVTDADGLTRVQETGITQKALEEMYAANGWNGRLIDPLYSFYGQGAQLLVSDGELQSLEQLAQVMDQLRSYMDLHPDDPLTPFERGALERMAAEIGSDALRDLAQKQIKMQNGDVLLNSYVTGLAYNGEVFFREVWVAGIHVASLHD